MIPMGLILLTNPIRRDAPETFRYFAQQGVAIKVISGDNPLTVSQIAAEAGIPGAENYVDASTLETEEALRTGAEQYTVWNTNTGMPRSRANKPRCSPRHRREIPSLFWKFHALPEAHSNFVRLRWNQFFYHWVSNLNLQFTLDF